MRWSTTIVTPSASEPLSVVEVMSHLRLDGTDEVAAVQGLIAAARSFVENHTERALVSQTRALHLEDFPCAVRLPGGLVTSVESVAYARMSDGAAQTIEAGSYIANLQAQPAILRPLVGQDWPAAMAMPGAVTITYTCGWPTAAAVPADLKRAMLLLIGDWYERRENTVAGATVATLPIGVAALLAPYRVMGFSPD